MRTTLPRTLVLAGALSLAFAFVACDHEAPPTTPAIDPETARRLFEHMEELVAALRTRQLAPAEHNLATTALPAEASTERTPANASLAALNDRIESLEREIAQLRLAASGRAIASPRSATPPAKMTGRVAQTIAQLADATTQAEGRRSLFMLSMPQVLDQLGLPDSTDFSGGDGMRWDYRHEKETLYLHFRGGVVMSIGSARD